MHTHRASTSDWITYSKRAVTTALCTSSVYEHIYIYIYIYVPLAFALTSQDVAGDACADSLDDGGGSPACIHELHCPTEEDVVTKKGCGDHRSKKGGGA